MTSASGSSIETYWVGPNGGIPNNPQLPALLYRRAIDPKTENLARQFENRFKVNGWSRTWRNGIFGFHHYHSNAHEVLGIARGSALVILGGPEGEEFTISAGDAVLLPAGFGHCKKSSSPDLLVIGAYPNGPDYDLCQAEDYLVQDAFGRINAVPYPETDPLGQAAMVANWPTMGQS